MPRKSKLTPELQEAICNDIALGMTFRQAAKVNGIGESTFYDWMAIGRQRPRGRERRFRDAVVQAEAEGAKALLTIIREAAVRGHHVQEVTELADSNGRIYETRRTVKRTFGDWRAAVRMLEMRHPEDYGKQVVTHEGNVGISGSSDLKIEFVFDDGTGQEDNSDATPVASETVFALSES